MLCKHICKYSKKKTSSALQRGQLVHLGLVGFVTFCKANLRTGQVTFSKTASSFASYIQKPAGGFFEPAFEKPKNQRLFDAGKSFENIKNQRLFDFHFTM
jgi:hypothetical protein